ncbi:hypothetical protein BSKO_07483 [Bryopsis sp. KO-2023]|nr:hypothetical protein BSKO_07483 [Bryopsis sp. KO-2023]
MTSARGDFLVRLQDELAELRKEVEVIEKKCAQKFLLLNRTPDDDSTDGTGSGLGRTCRRVSSFDKLSQNSTERSFKSRIPRSSSTTDHSCSEDLGSPAPRAFKFKSKGRMTFPRPVNSLGAAGRLVDCAAAYPPSSTSSSSFCSRETLSVGSGEFKRCGSPQSTLEAMSAPQSRCLTQTPQTGPRRLLESTSLRWEHLECGSGDGSKIPRAPRPSHLPRCFSALGWSESGSLVTRLSSLQKGSAVGRGSPCPSFSSIGGYSARLEQEGNSTSRLPSPPVSDDKRLRGCKLREPYAEFNIGCL